MNGPLNVKHITLSFFLNTAYFDQKLIVFRCFNTKVLKNKKNVVKIGHLTKVIEIFYFGFKTFVLKHLKMISF